MSTTSMDDEQEELMTGGEIPDENQEENDEVQLPPLASGNGWNIWFSQEVDKNGNRYAVIDAPGHNPVRVFFSDAVKPTMNQLQEEWKQRRQEDGGGQ